MATESELEITVSQIEHGIRQKNQLLNAKNKEYVNLVETRAQKKREWKIAYRLKMIELSGEPATTKKDMVNGDRNVSKLEMEFEIALGVEKACYESMKDLRSQIDALRSFLSWHKSERFGSSI